MRFSSSLVVNYILSDAARYLAFLVNRLSYIFVIFYLNKNSDGNFLESFNILVFFV